MSCLENDLRKNVLQWPLPAEQCQNRGAADKGTPRLPRVQLARGFLSTRHLPAPFLQPPPQPWLLSSGSKAYLGPLGELPLGPTGLVLAGFPLHGPGQPRCLAEVVVDGAVEARRQHLPAAHGAVLGALAAGAGALAPPAGLPPPRAERAQRSTQVRGTRGTGWQGCARVPGAPSPSSCCCGSAHHIRVCINEGLALKPALPSAGNLGAKFFPSFCLQGDTRTS